MTRLFLDFETFSRADLKKVGLDVYARHKSTEAMMLSYAFDGDPVEQWVPAEGQKQPRDLKDALDDPAVIKQAWNAQFEHNIFRHVLGQKVRISEWRCTMALAATLSLPLSLDKAGQVIGLPPELQKDREGGNLIRTFSVPQKITKRRPFDRHNHVSEPDKWERFKFYNRQDVEAERAIWRRIRKWDMPAEEWALWHLDQRINNRGIPINLDVVDAAIDLAEYAREEKYAELRQITGLSNPRSREQMLEWLRAEGYPFEDLKSGHVKRALERLEEEEGDAPVKSALRRVLELRAEVSKTSVDKFYALDRAADQDTGVIRNAFQFAAAGRTWRWGGRIYQPQNLARPPKQFEKPEAIEVAIRDIKQLSPRALCEKYDKPMDLLSALVRPVVEAPPGYLLVDADLNAIENRVLGWLADCPKIINVFANNLDPYVAFASELYETKYETLYAEYKAGDKSKRTIAKPGVLGCGYMLGAGKEIENEKTGEIEATGLLGYGWAMGVKLTLEQAEQSVRVWRDAHPEVVEFWYDIERAAKKCVRTGQPTRCGYVSFDMSGPFLRMLLPSGRALHYVRPRLETKMMSWGKTKEVLTYEGLNDKNQWVRISTHPGKIVENADQAISRDLLAHGMLLAEKEGIPVRLHVHDQLVGVVRENRADDDLRVLIECMCVVPKWAPGLPLGAAGNVSKFFLKD